MRAHSPLGSIIVVSVFAATLASCGVQPLSVIGEQCELNSDCDDPLVCGLGRCRRQCEASRDCALGLRCIKLKEPVVQGVCQLPEEKTCSLNSDCQEPLVCFMPGGCDLACATDDDCVPGATCTSGQCKEPEVALCVHDSDCGYPLVCDARQTCIAACTTDLDCDLGLACVPHEACTGADGMPTSPCMCRQPCAVGGSGCPLGTECVACDGAECGSVEGFCERPMSAGTSG